MLRAVNSVPFQTGLSLERTTPRMATSGALTMGVKLVPPMPPRLEMVNVPPAMSDGPSLPSRALADGHELPGQFHDALAVGVRNDRDHQARRGVHGDADVVVVLEDEGVCSGDSEELNSGNF